MAKIACKHTGHVFYTTSDLKIVPLVSFSLISVLSPALPSSEEGRTAFQITERVEAKVLAQFNSNSFMLSSAKKTKKRVKNEDDNEAEDEEMHIPSLGQYSEIIHEATVDSFSEINAVGVESSQVYAMMGDKNKKKLQMRLRNLISAVAEKEAIATNAELLADNTTLAAAEAKIDELSFKINRLLLAYSTKPFIALKPLGEAVDEYATKYGVSDEDKAKLSSSLLKQYHDGFSVTG
jgi:hypothetical protein